MSYSWIAGNEHIPDTSDFRVREFEFSKEDRLWPNNDRLEKHIKRRGRHNEIYRAEDREGREVVVKINRPDRVEKSDYKCTVSGNKEAYSRLQRVSNPNLVTPLESFVGDVKYFFESEKGRSEFDAMNDYHIVVLDECVEWPTLKALLSDEESSVEKGDPKMARDIVESVASGLAVVHDEDVVHQDVQFRNIFFDPETRDVKLYDFDHAHIPYFVDQHEEGDYCLRYPPELVDGGLMDQQWDVYSLGGLWFQLAHGVKSYKEPWNIESDDLNEDVPEIDNEIMTNCIYPDREERYDDAGELLMDMHYRTAVES